MESDILKEENKSQKFYFGLISFARASRRRGVEGRKEQEEEKEEEGRGEEDQGMESLFFSF